MDEQSKFDIRDAAGCLGSIPSRAGMSCLVTQVAMSQVMAGAHTVVFDKGSSTELFATSLRNLAVEQVQSSVRVGRKRNSTGKSETHVKTNRITVGSK